MARVWTNTSFERLPLNGVACGNGPLPAFVSMSIYDRRLG